MFQTCLTPCVSLVQTCLLPNVSCCVPPVFKLKCIMERALEICPMSKWELYTHYAFRKGLAQPRHKSFDPTLFDELVSGECSNSGTLGRAQTYIFLFL